MADVETFESLVTGHQREIYAYILRMVGSDGEAQDLCQETFLKAYRAFDGLDGAPNYRAWLYKIATNTALSALRRQRRGADVIDALAMEQPGSRDDDQADCLGRKELLLRVEQAIQLLPVKQRLAFTQRRLLGLSYPEIAAALDCNEEAARANVYQAARKLREQFAVELDEVGI